MTKTMMAGLAAGLAAFSLYAAQPAATALVSVDLSKEEGPVKLMNRRGTHPTERAFYRYNGNNSFSSHTRLAERDCSLTTESVG